VVKDDIGFLDLAEISERAAKYKFNILNVKRLSSLKTEATRSPDGTKVGCIEVVLSGQDDHDFDALRLSLMEMQHETGRLVGTICTLTRLDKNSYQTISDYTFGQTVEDHTQKTHKNTNSHQRTTTTALLNIPTPAVRPDTTGFDWGWDSGQAATWRCRRRDCSAATSAWW
jgi:hypothetical protein